MVKRRKLPTFKATLPVPFSLKWDAEAALWMLDLPPDWAGLALPALLYEEFNTGREIHVFGHDNLDDVSTILQERLRKNDENGRLDAGDLGEYTVYQIDEKTIRLKGPGVERLCEVMQVPLRTPRNKGFMKAVYADRVISYLQKMASHPKRMRRFQPIGLMCS